MATLQVRSIDERLYGALGRRAEMDHRSISQEVVAILNDYLACPAKTPQGAATDAFLELAGSWTDDRDADAVMAEIRKARTTNRFNRLITSIS